MAFTGRLQEIYTLVRFHAKEASHADTIMEPIVLALCNSCNSDLTRRGLFRTSDALDTTAGTAEYDYPEDAASVLDVYWNATGERLRRINNDRHYRFLLSQCASGTPQGRFLNGRQIILWPTPTETTTGAATVTYAYFPAAFTGTDETGCTPPTPLGYDQVYVAFCLKQLFGAKRGLTKQDSLFARWAGEYEKEVNRLRLQGMSL